MVVKAVEVAGLPEEEEKVEVVVGLPVEEEGKEEVVDGLLEEVEDGLQEEVEDGQVVVAAEAGMRVEQLKIGGERYLLNFINTYLY